MKLVSFRLLGLLGPLLSLVFFGSVSLAQTSALRLLEVPRPELPADYGTLDAQGTIRLKVTFLDDGTVGEIYPISRIDIAGLTELAIKSAKRIKFNPKIENGQAKASARTIEYFYGLQCAGWCTPTLDNDPRAEAVVQKAIQNLGGEKYLNVKTQIGRGKYSIIKEGAVVSFQTFTDVIVYPDKERTDFRGAGSRSVQTNVANGGWVYDGDQDLVKDQNEAQIQNFKRGIRTSLDYLLRGHWRNEGELSYVGKRAATLGKRNDVIKLTYKDGLVVEFEFAADDGTPQKGSYKRLNADNEEIVEEDRYAQFVDVAGIKTPFIIDRFSGGKQSSRINYQTVEFNKAVSDSIFTKPANAKALKDMKL
jgi:hypothetical protein